MATTYNDMTWHAISQTEHGAKLLMPVGETPHIPVHYLRKDKTTLRDVEIEDVPEWDSDKSAPAATYGEALVDVYDYDVQCVAEDSSGLSGAELNRLCSGDGSIENPWKNLYIALRDMGCLYSNLGDHFCRSDMVRLIVTGHVDDFKPASAMYNVPYILDFTNATFSAEGIRVFANEVSEFSSWKYPNYSWYIKGIDTYNIDAKQPDVNGRKYSLPFEGCTLDKCKIHQPVYMGRVKCIDSTISLYTEYSDRGAEYNYRSENVMAYACTLYEHDNAVDIASLWYGWLSKCRVTLYKTWANNIAAYDTVIHAPKISNSYAEALYKCEVTLEPPEDVLQETHLWKCYNCEIKSVGALIRLTAIDNTTVTITNGYAKMYANYMYRSNVSIFLDHYISSEYYAGIDDFIKTIGCNIRIEHAYNIVGNTRMQLYALDYPWHTSEQEAFHIEGTNVSVIPPVCLDSSALWGCAVHGYSVDDNHKPPTIKNSHLWEGICIDLSSDKWCTNFKCTYGGSYG